MKDVTRDYPLLPPSVSEGDFDGYSLKVTEVSSGSVLWSASGEVHTMDALVGLARAASHYTSARTGCSAALTLFCSRTGVSGPVDLDALLALTEQHAERRLPFSVIVK